MDRVAGARAINNGSTIVHRPSRPEKLTLRADVEVALAVEGKVGTRQDALFPLAHVPNRDVRRDAGADHPMEKLADRVPLERLLAPRLTFDRRKPADLVALEQSMQRRSREMRDG